MSRQRSQITRQTDRQADSQTDRQKQRFHASDSDEVFIWRATFACERHVGPGTLGDREGLWTGSPPLARVVLMQDSPDLRTDDVSRSQAQECHHAPHSYPLGDVTGLLNVKVRPRLNKDLNHCHCQKTNLCQKSRSTTTSRGGETDRQTDRQTYLTERPI